MRMQRSRRHAKGIILLNFARKRFDFRINTGHAPIGYVHY